MRGVYNVLNYLRHLTSSKLLVGSLFALAVTISGGALLYGQQAAHAAACRDNDIIRCGVSNREDFKNKMNQNATGDLTAIYSHYGGSADEVATKAVEGTAYKDGTIHVDGRIVATDVKSIGRNAKSYSTPVNMGGRTYHESRSQNVFVGNSLSVLVVMGDNNMFKYAIIKECGNPARGNPTPPPAQPQQPPAPPEKPPEQPKQPVYECTNLRAIRVNNESTERTYKFQVSYRAEDGATLDSVDFDFDDGETQVGVQPDSGEDTVTSREVTYSSPGEKTITTNLKFNVDGQIRPVRDEACETAITIPEPNKIVVCRDGKTQTILESEKRASDLPEGSEKCQPEEPAQPTKADTPPPLPSTGPAEIVGGAVGMGSIAGAGYYFRASRRNLFDSIFKS